MMSVFHLEKSNDTFLESTMRDSSVFMFYLLQFQHLWTIQVNIFLIDTFNGHFAAFVET